MANQYEDDEDDLDVDTSQNEAPANLRKALKRAEKEKKDLAEQLASIHADLRSRNVKDVLATKGVPDKVAKFIPADVSTPEQVDAWLEENSDVFGFSKSEADAPADEEKQANIRSYDRINAATQNVNSPTRDADLLAKLNGATSIQELNAVTGLSQQRRR
jgi:hypothetical protein